MNKNESKYFNTSVKMDEALLVLLDKKDFAYITIKEICHQAGVNRSTFYLHYENTSDLLREATQYILDKHFSYYNLTSRNAILHGNNDNLSDLIFITDDYLVPYLTFIKDNKRLFKVAIKRFHSLNMDEVYHKMFDNIFEPILSRFDVIPKERPFVIKFYLSGIFAIVTEWLDDDCEEDISLITKIITDCVMGWRKING